MIARCSGFSFGFRSANCSLTQISLQRYYSVDFETLVISLDFCLGSAKEWSLYTLNVSTYRGQIGPMHTKRNTKPVPSPSKLDTRNSSHYIALLRFSRSRLTDRRGFVRLIHPRARVLLLPPFALFRVIEIIREDLSALPFLALNQSSPFSNKWGKTNYFLVHLIIDS